jgi:HEAT repeat protein
MRIRLLPLVFVACHAAWVAAEPPSPAEVAAAAVRLREALESREEGEIVPAIEAAKGMQDPVLVTLLERALRSPRAAVRESAIQALGALSDRRSLEALHRFYYAEPKLGENEWLLATLLKEIGRRGDPGSISVLADAPMRYLTYSVGTARVMGLANIRDKRAVDALAHLARQAGGRGIRGLDPQGSEPLRRQYRVAMAVLTGVDQGSIPNDWADWWQRSAEGFDLPKSRPPVPDDVAAAWESYWGLPYYEDGKGPRSAPLAAPFQRIANPTEQRVEDAVAALSAAFDSRKEAEIALALELYGGVLDRKVVHELARGLRSPSRRIRLAAIDALGWMQYKPALQQLHRLYVRENRAGEDDEEMYVRLIQAIGRSGDKSSVAVFRDNPFRNLTLASGRAKIFALARVRDRTAVEALLKAMLLAGETPPRTWRPSAEPRFMDDLRFSLKLLTGVDQGSDKARWQAWWRDEKKQFEVLDWPAVAPSLVQRYQEYWHEPYPGRIVEESR